MREPRNINNPPLSKHVNTNLFDPSAYNVHRSPITWLKTALNGIQFEACGPTGFIREVAEIVQA